ncbi:MAG: hypothetical protein WA146_15555 [Thiobacillus sp.]
MKLATKKPQFEQAVDDALEIHRSLVAVCSTYGDARDEKLSAKGYMAEALHNARCDLKKIELLDKTVSRLPEDGNADLLRFVAQVTKQAAATRVDQGCNLRPVTGNLHYFVNSDNNAMVGVIVQSNALGSNPFELVALAAYRATRDNPENFGRIDDWDAHEAAQEQKHARLNELYAQIAETWKEAPIEWDGVNPQVRYGDVVVPVAPPDTLGARLCEALA